MTEEEKKRLGHLIKPVKHSMKRRAEWHDYSRAGIYLITICVKQYDDGSYYAGTLLSTIGGSSNLLPPVPAVSELPCRHPGYLAPSPYLPLTEDKGRGHLPLTEDEGGPAHPHTVLSELGAMVWHHIWQIGSYRGEEDVQVQMAVCMPTHIHMILKVGRHLPFKRNGQPMSLGDVVRGFKQGCTSAFKRWLRGEPMELPSGYQRQWLTPPGAVSEISLWDDNYNDRVILDTAGLQSSVAYICMNPWRWRLLDQHPDLLKHLLHITIADTEYSAYGCMFLLRHPCRQQVFCHRYARKGSLTPDEWQFASLPSTAERLEREAIANKKTMGGWTRDWLRSSSPNAVCPIPYHKTHAFRQQKAELLAISHWAILVSPAVSPGEREIFYDAIAQGGRGIKILRKPLPAKAHPQDKDIALCARAQLLVLGPWQIEHHEYRTARGEMISSESKYAQFHDLNAMAARLCAHSLGRMTWRDTFYSPLTENNP